MFVSFRNDQLEQQIRSLKEALQKQQENNQNLIKEIERIKAENKLNLEEFENQMDSMSSQFQYERQQLIIQNSKMVQQLSSFANDESVIQTPQKIEQEHHISKLTNEIKIPENSNQQLHVDSINQGKSVQINQFEIEKEKQIENLKQNLNNSQHLNKQLQNQIDLITKIKEERRSNINC